VLRISFDDVDLGLSIGNLGIDVRSLLLSILYWLNHYIVAMQGIRLKAISYYEFIKNE
jgi:hypothetical protein